MRIYWQKYLSTAQRYNSELRITIGSLGKKWKKKVQNLTSNKGEILHRTTLRTTPPFDWFLHSNFWKIWPTYSTNMDLYETEYKKTGTREEGKKSYPANSIVQIQIWLLTYADITNTRASKVMPYFLYIPRNQNQN